MELLRKLRNLRNAGGNAVSADSLSARDYSWEAHKVLLSCVLVQGVLEGLPLCFGIFQNHYQHYLYPGYENSSWIGDTAIGLMWLGAPLMSYLVEERHMKPERFIFAAWGLCVVSLIGTAFCTTISTLAITQGALLGLSVLLMEMPGLIILNSWFVERRGFAYGVLFAFNDVFGTIWAYLGRHLLQVYDLKITMLVFAGIAAILPAFFIWTFKSRPEVSCPDVPLDLPGSTTGDQQDAVGSQSAANPDRKFYMRPLFWFLIITSCAQSFAFYVPSIYLPTYNMQVVARITDCTLENTNLLAVFNLAQIPGEFVFGWLSDRYNSHALAVASCLMPCIVTILLWAGVVGRISATFGSLMVFASVFGAFAAGFGSLWGRMSMGFGLQQSQMVFALMSLARGLSTVASAPISSALIGGEGGAHNADIDTALVQLGHESPYGGLILFVGCCMGIAALAAAAGWVANRMDERKGNMTTVSSEEDIAVEYGNNERMDEKEGDITIVSREGIAVHRKEEKTEMKKATTVTITEI